MDFFGICFVMEIRFARVGVALGVPAQAMLPQEVFFVTNYKRTGVLFYGLFVFWCVLIGRAQGALDRSPLSVSNRFPMHFIFLSPRPVSAQLPAEGTITGELALDYSSVYFDRQSDTYAFLMDMEALVAELSLTYSLTERLGLRLHVPMVSMNSGFLDGFLESYHDALGVSNYGRENRPHDNFAYRLTKGRETWVDGSTGEFGWTDITVSVQWGLFRAGQGRCWQSSLLASAKAPTGDPEFGYGSGRWDFALFMPNQWSFQRWTLHLMPGLIYHDDPETLGAEVSAQNSYSLFGGAAYHYNERWTWLAQLNYFSSPIEDTGVSRIDDGALELALGFRRILARNWHLAFAFCEDPFTLAAPDFTVHMGLSWAPSTK